MDTTQASHIRDHNRLTALVHAVARELIIRGGSRAALECCERLASALRAHLADEEAHLFPRIEALVGDPQFSVTASLRRQHEVLRSLLEVFEEDLRRSDVRAGRNDLRELEAALTLHAAAEERALHPLLGSGAVAHDHSAA